MQEKRMRDDAISRQALMKEFADFVRRSNNSDFAPTPTWNDAVSLVGSMPSAQPEIIYCKKCKHWTETCGDKQWGLGDCDVFDKHLVMCNGYCAWAERREE